MHFSRKAKHSAVHLLPLRRYIVLVYKRQFPVINTNLSHWRESNKLNLTSDVRSDHDDKK